MTQETRDTKQIKVGISYAWGNDEMIRRLDELEGKLKQYPQLKVVRDTNELKYGHMLDYFTNFMIMDSHVVLIMLSPEYKAKASEPKTGVGKEAKLIDEAIKSSAPTQVRFLPVLFEGNATASCPAFLENLYRADLRPGKGYEEEFQKLLNQILVTKTARPKDNLIMELPTVDKDHIQVQLDTNLESALLSLLTLKSNSPDLGTALKKQMGKWESSIKKGHEEFSKHYTERKLSLYRSRPQSFSNDVLRKILWTLKAALKPYEPGMEEFNTRYNQSDPFEVYKTVMSIKEAGENYNQAYGLPAPAPDEEMGMSFLQDEKYLLKGVIGSGIRSEILYRLYPGAFPIMTRRNLWAMYFLSGQAEEFILTEKSSKTGEMRVTHNWNYDYPRFVSYARYIYDWLTIFCQKLDIPVDPSIGYGYVNELMVDYASTYKKEIDLLNKWSYNL